MADYSIEVSIPNAGPVGPQGPPGEFGDLEAPQDGVIYGRKDGEWVDMTAPANLQVRRGTAEEVAAITPLEGEPVWKTDTKKLVIGDGSTQGGVLVSDYPMQAEPSPTTAVAGKLFTADKLNAIGSFFGPPKVLGGTRGVASVDMQLSRLATDQVASGFGSVVLGGENNKASGNYCVVLGGNTATAGPGANALVYGSSSVASGNNSIALGFNCVASASSSMAIQGAIADRFGMFAKGESASAGERSQSVEFILRASTTNATPTQMQLASNVKLTIPENVALYGTIEISAIEVTTASESAFYIRKFGIKNVGGSTSLIGLVTTVGTDHESTAGMDVAITADDTDDFLKVEVTGLASTNLRWLAVVRGSEAAIA